MVYEIIPRNISQLIRNPFSLPDVFQDYISQFGNQIQGFGHEMSGVELSEDKNNVYIHAPMPGLDHEEDIDIDIEKGMVRIKGDKKRDESNKDKRYYSKSRRSYWFQVALPSNVDENQDPKAVYRNGVLELTLAKTKSKHSKKIKIKGER